MALYLVGDIQGCYDELRALLNKVNFNPNDDQLWAAGDIVARGKDSLKTVRYLMSLGDSFKMVLGNHDLHLMAIHYGIKKAKPSDLLTPLLNADEIDEIIEWFRHQPLLLKIPQENAYVSHAGLSPQWTIQQATKQARFAENILQSDDYVTFLSAMYGETPNSWQLADNKIEKFRYTVNAFTRMRYCFSDGSLEFKCKQPIELAPDNLKPWFELSKELDNISWIFGHWAALMGKCAILNTYALDTGCVWGHHLTLLRWQDKTLFLEYSHQ
jgi:bis(5'-nucleosyl)-tetraphosphatase (symmetrical)